MKKTILKRFKLILSTLIVLFLLLEIIFQWIIPGANLPVRTWNDTYKLVHFEPNQQGVFTLGKLAQERYEWNINNTGWNAPIDYFPKTDSNKTRIAVIGDSYIEAFQTSYTTSYPSILRQHLDSNSYEVYSFGISGSALSQYLHISRYVDQEFQPDVLVFNTVYNDFKQSIDQYSKRDMFMRLDISDSTNIQEISPTKSSNSYQLFKKSGFLRYMIYNIKIMQIKNLINNNNSKKKYNKNIDANEVKKAINYILLQLKLENPNKRIIFLLDDRRQDIQKENTNSSNIFFLEKTLANACNKQNIEFISLNSVFIADFNQNKTTFTSSFDGHWNTYGHQTIGNYLFHYLQHQMH